MKNETLKFPSQGLAISGHLFSKCPNQGYQSYEINLHFLIGSLKVPSLTYCALFHDSRKILSDVEYILGGRRLSHLD